MSEEIINFPIFRGLSVLASSAALIVGLENNMNDGGISVGPPPHHVYENYGPCQRPASAPDAVFQERARICQKAERQGKIALVGFDVEPQSLQDAARQATIGLKVATAGQVTASFEPVMASPAALEADRARQQACVDTDRLADFLPIAAKTMPELQEYTFVASVSRRKPCDGKTAGVADYVNYAEILGSDSMPGEHEAAIAIHEVLHLLGPNHVGDTSPRLSLNSPATFDLTSYFRTARYAEYGSGAGPVNIMGHIQLGSGGISQNGQYKPTPMQLAALRWPQNELAGKIADDAERLVGTSAITFNLAAAQQGEYAVLTIDPVTFVEKPERTNDEPKKTTFDSLIVIPEIDHKSNPKQPCVADATLYLVDSSSNKSAWLGSGFRQSSACKPASLKRDVRQVFSIGNKTLLLDLSNGILTVDS